jgi:hypothetical protein
MVKNCMFGLELSGTLIVNINEHLLNLHTIFQLRFKLSIFVCKPFFTGFEKQPVALESIYFSK